MGQSLQLTQVVEGDLSVVVILVWMGSLPASSSSSASWDKASWPASSLEPERFRQSCCFRSIFCFCFHISPFCLRHFIPVISILIQVAEPILKVPTLDIVYRMKIVRSVYQRFVSTIIIYNPSILGIFHGERCNTKIFCHLFKLIIGDYVGPLVVLLWPTISFLQSPVPLICEVFFHVLRAWIICGGGIEGCDLELNSVCDSGDDRGVEKALHFAFVLLLFLLLIN